MARSEWIDYVCKFCKQMIEPQGFVPPDCDCEGYQAAREAWLEEYRSSPDYKPPMTEEEFTIKCPQTFLGERKVVDSRGTHRLQLEARNYEGNEGLTVCIPFDEEDDSGLCWDFGAEDAPALHELLTEYLEKKNGRT